MIVENYQRPLRRFFYLKKGRRLLSMAKKQNDDDSKQALDIESIFKKVVMLEIIFYGCFCR